MPTRPTRPTRPTCPRVTVCPRLMARWLALGILFIGIVLVQSPKVAEEASGSHSAVLGMAAVVSACLLSGLAGVWLERIVKRTNEVPPRARVTATRCRVAVLPPRRDLTALLSHRAHRGQPRSRGAAEPRHAAPRQADTRRVPLSCLLSRQVSIWLRSIQLGLVSLVLGIGSVAVCVDTCVPGPPYGT